MLSINYDPTRQSLYHPELRPTVFIKPDRPNPTALAVEAARLAYLRFEDDNAQRDRLNQALAQVGFGSARHFIHEPSNGAGFGSVDTDGFALLAFRGTQADHVVDLLTDANIVQQPWSLGPGNVHAGFARSALGLWPEIEKWLRDAVAPKKTLLICGHSLGAALATLLALPSGAQHLITIGSPRVGDAHFCAALTSADHLNITRIVDCCDGVTQVPPQSLNYQHAGSTTYIDRSGLVTAHPVQQTMDDDRDKARAAYLARYALIPDNVGIRELADHSPINYVRAFWP